MSRPTPIDIPESLYRALVEAKGGENVSRWVAEALVVGAVREGIVSRGKGVELLGLGFTQREEFYAQRGVVYDFTDEELASDLKNIEEHR